MKKVPVVKAFVFPVLIGLCLVSGCSSGSHCRQDPITPPSDVVDLASEEFDSLLAAILEAHESCTFPADLLSATTVGGDKTADTLGLECFGRLRIDRIDSETIGLVGIDLTRCQNGEPLLVTMVYLEERKAWAFYWPERLLGLQPGL